MTKTTNGNTSQACEIARLIGEAADRIAAMSEAEFAAYCRKIGAAR